MSCVVGLPILSEYIGASSYVGSTPRAECISTSCASRGGGGGGGGLTCLREKLERRIGECSRRVVSAVWCLKGRRERRVDRGEPGTGSGRESRGVGGFGEGVRGKRRVGSFEKCKIFLSENQQVPCLNPTRAAPSMLRGSRVLNFGKFRFESGLREAAGGRLGADRFLVSPTNAWCQRMRRLAAH